MKKTIIVLVFYYSLFITHYSFSQSGWFPLNSGTSVLLNKIQFVNSQTGWAGGYQSFPSQYVLIKTTNGGITWINQIASLPFGNRIISLFFIDANTGWIAGAEGIFKTTNGGNNYFTVTNPMPIIYDCFFINSTIGWAVGLESNAGIAKTTNGGNNWIQQTVNIIPSEQIFYIHFENEMTGWCTGPSYILKTTNGGNNWFSQPHPGVSLINRIFAISPDIAWVTASGTVLTTTNGGINWIARDIGSSYSAMSAYFLNANTGYVCTSPRNVFKTTNNGLNWLPQMTDTASGFSSIYFTSYDTGYVCGSSGKIYKTVNGGGTIGLKKISDYIPSKIKLHQNYPNPFNPSTSIKYQVESIKDIKLIVYDILGKKVATLINEKQTPGTYEVTFDGSGLSSGIYFYKLEVGDPLWRTGDFQETKKMLLIK